MEDKFKLIEFNDDDVIESNDWTYKFSKLKQALEKVSANTSFLTAFWNVLREQKIYYIERHNYYNTECFTEGMDVKILNLGSQSWKKGKLKFKLSIEFYVEEEDTQIQEPESPLDDLRRMINETT
ncbi:KGK domain-containing protein [Anabaena lutea]|uniref:KGK domain protein n=1 Tax=Anabaena lutea FACHB-196 TaxID=2692881 RepID=A0ABR8F9M5_9NOST|nr:KGK domain-containing protein [Anabaena lutea]MBD2566761.1 KGK domain protein [Anabaena lutea FACHB-196]